MSNISELIGCGDKTIDDVDGTAKYSSSGSELGRIYLMKFEMPDTKEIVWKVGKSSGNNSVDRFMQIIKSMYIRYRVSPKGKIKRDRVVDKPYNIETKIHNLLKEYKYLPSKKFDGHTEFFKCEEELIVNIWESVVIS